MVYVDGLYWKFIVPSDLSNIDITKDSITIWNAWYNFDTIKFALMWKPRVYKFTKDDYWKRFLTYKRSQFRWLPVKITGIHDSSWPKKYYTIMLLDWDIQTLAEDSITKKTVSEDVAEQFVIRKDIEEKIKKDKEKAKREKKSLMRQLYEVEEVLFAHRNSSDMEEFIKKEIEKRKVTEKDIKERYPFIKSYKETENTKTFVFDKWIVINWGWKPKYISNCTYKIVCSTNWVQFVEWRHPHISKNSWSVCMGWFSRDFTAVLATWDKYLLVELLYTFITSCWVSDMWWGENKPKYLVQDKVFLPYKDPKEDVKEAKKEATTAWTPDWTIC